MDGNINWHANPSVVSSSLHGLALMKTTVWNQCAHFHISGWTPYMSSQRKSFSELPYRTLFVTKIPSLQDRASWHLANSETHTDRSQKSWPFLCWSVPRFLPSLLFCVALQPPRLACFGRHLCFHSHETIWLKPRHRGAWNENGICRWPARPCHGEENISEHGTTRQFCWLRLFHR